MSNDLMRPEKSKRAALFLAASLILASSNAIACSCAPYPDDPAEAAAMAYSRADAIFVGVVSAVQSKRLRFLFVRDATMDVKLSWKGVSGQDVTVVRSAIGSIACGFDLQKHGSYLVFAYWDEEQEVLWTNMCELTRKESEAHGLIRELNQLKRQEDEAYTNSQ